MEELETYKKALQKISDYGVKPTGETEWQRIKRLKSIADKAICIGSEQSPEKGYDSKEDTLNHISRVDLLLKTCARELERRGSVHDLSKLSSPEKELFDELTPKLKETTYGSDEYYEYLEELKVALDHHYKHNSHHPEFYPDGINGFDLFDLIEMFMDWKAASERHDDGDIYRSINLNKERFEISDQLESILVNTAKRMGW